MKRFTWILAASAVLLTPTASGSRSHNVPSDSPFLPQIQGTWLSNACEGPSNGTYQRVGLLIAGMDVVVAVRSYLAPDCSGTAVATATRSGTFTVDSPVTASLAAASVTAYPFNFTASAGGSTRSMYTLGYVDASTPTRLYMGDQGGENDGSNLALRSTTLDAATWFTRQ
jgi:hypothetical protein